MSDTSFCNYESMVSAKLRALNHQRRVAFALWAAERCLQEHESAFVGDLGASRAAGVQNVIDRVWSDLSQDRRPSASDVQEIRNDLNRLLSTFDAIELHPATIEICVGLEHLVEAIASGSIKASADPAYRLISILDCELDDGDPTYDAQLKTLFTHPAMAKELARQLETLDRLSSATAVTDVRPAVTKP